MRVGEYALRQFPGLERPLFACRRELRSGHRVGQNAPDLSGLADGVGGRNALISREPFVELPH